MKKLIINTPFENADLTSKKARLISVIDDTILVCNYAGIYMLPGGKLDNNENFEEAIIREIKEETGESIVKNDVKEYLSIYNYQKNYRSRKYPTPIDKETKTVYYITDKKIRVQKGLLSESEKEGNMRTFYIKIKTLKDLLKNEERAKHKVFAQELLEVIKEYEREHKLIDLHTHTTFSDGEYTPDEIINQARCQNIGTIAITDHDNIEGLKTIDYNKYPDIKVLPGVEITAQVKKGRMHILGYLIDYYNKELNDFLRTVRKNNINNLKNMIDYLKYLNITFRPDELEAMFNRQGNIGRPDLAELLIKNGYVETIKEAFDKYLIDAFNESRCINKGYPYEMILNIIKKSQGISVLAHPTSLELNHEEFEELLKDMIKSGLMGLEAIHPNIPLEERAFLMDMVNKYHLLYSVGSDFHGKHVKEDIELGTGRGDIYQRDASILQYINKNY